MAMRPQQEAGVWGKLVVEGLGKAELRARRGEELRRKRERDEERRKQAAERAAQDERLAVRKQMAIDEAERRHVEELKEEEKANAEVDSAPPARVPPPCLTARRFRPPPSGRAR